MASPFDKFYSGDMAPPAIDKYGAFVNTPNKASQFKVNRGGSSSQGAGELTTRTVKTVAIDPFTGQPIAAGGGGSTGANPAVLAQMNKNATGRGLPADYRSQYNNWVVDYALRDAVPQRIALDKNGQQVQPIGYNPQQDNPAVTAAITMGNGGKNIKPGWINAPSFNSGPKFPVTASPEIRTAYADMVAGEPGAMDRYGKLLADQAGQGNIRISSGGGGGSSGGGSSSSGVPAGQLVKIATGKTATSGQTYQQGANGAGKPYTYQVQPNGSIKNLTTGRITAPATR